MSLPDESNDVIFLLQSGDEKALQSLSQLYYRPLCFFATRLLKDQLSGEDIVEESFLKLWQRRNDFKNLQNIKSFLYITTRNACLNSIKQQQRVAVSKTQLGYLADEQEGYILNEIVRTEVMAEITTLIDKLPGQCRKIFVLSYVNGYKNHEIATALNISIHTVKNQKVRAIRLLKIKLQNRNLMI